MQLKQFGINIWICEGSKVNFYGFPFTTRMTVVRLPDGKLWIHSPEQLNDELQDELSALGEVRYLVSPNKLHHLFLTEWISAYPHATKYSAPGLPEKRKDIKFDFDLTDAPVAEWGGEIDQTVFYGSPVMEEVVFCHKPSKTLILTDLIENFSPSSLNWWHRGLAKVTGILSPNGKMPIDWRLSFAFGDKQRARDSLGVIMNWDFENIILAHGECVLGDGREYFTRSFEWLSKNA